MTDKHNKLMWAIIAGMNWAERSASETRAYDSIKIEFMRQYSEETARKVNDFVKERFNELYAAYDLHEANGGERCGNYGGDDSFGDMLHHVIGMGEEAFNAVMEDMTRLNNVRFVESFSYALPHTNSTFNDYENMKPEVHIKEAKRCIKEITDMLVSDDFNSDDSDVAIELLRRFIAMRFGYFKSAVGDLEKEVHYERYHEFGSEGGVHALFANVLFDAKQYMIVE